MSKKNNLGFYNRLERYRLTASLLYDRGVSEGLSPIQISESLSPLFELLNNFIERSVRDDFEGVVLGIKMLENEVEKHINDSKILEDKAENTLRHIHTLKQSIKNYMNMIKINELKVGDYWATLIGEVLNLR